MSQDNIKALKNAADLLKAGNTKDARPIIIQVLRDEPENVQAWYMLSFAVPRQDKQIDALVQLLKIDPTNEKAKARLEKLGGTLPAESAAPTEAPKPDAAPAAPPVQKTETPSPSAEESSDDLLAQRLFGESPSTESTEPNSSRISQSSFIEDTDTSDNENDPNDETKENLKSKKVFGLNRRTFMLLISALIFSGIAYMVISISGSLNLFANSQPNDNGEAIAQISATPTMEDNSTQELTEDEATATLAPPTPTTPPPTATPKPFSFTTSDLLPPTDDTLAEMLDIQDQIGAIMELSEDYPVDSYSITQSRLEAFLWEFDNLPELKTNSTNFQTFLTAVGLAQSSDDYKTFYSNIGVDPNGTIYLPKEELIAVTGFVISPYQKFSYTQAYIQHIRNTQVSFGDLGIFPPCDLSLEACEINTALIKGEAAVIASEWANANLAEEDLTKIDEATKKVFFIYPVPSASTLMEEIRLFPYEKGAEFASAIYQSGGIEALNQLYDIPPTTTEQILHPEKYLQGEGAIEVNAVDISDLVPSDYQEFYNGSFGEWKTYLLLAYGLDTNTRIMPEDAAIVAEGWGGDNLQIFINDNSDQILAGHWTFDTPIDAQQFNEAIKNFSSKFVSGLSTEIAGLPCNRSALHTTCVVYTENDVIWLLTPDQDTMEALIQGVVGTD